jgi:hypothetical protein
MVPPRTQSMIMIGHAAGRPQAFERPGEITRSVDKRVAHKNPNATRANSQLELDANDLERAHWSHS